MEEKGGGAQTRERFSSVEALEEALEEAARSFRVRGRRPEDTAKIAAATPTLQTARLFDIESVEVVMTNWVIDEIILDCCVSILLSCSVNGG